MTTAVKLFVVWLAFAGLLSAVHAATLTGRKDIMSRDQVSASANHEIRFITPTGVDAPSDTITVSFPSGFNLSSVVFGDIDLFHGAVTGLETNETLAAAPAAGVWGAAVSGQSIIFTAPTDAALGEIAANDKVVIRIGTNAVGGTHQIINPSSADVYTLSIAGTFNDAGGISIPIIAADTIGVSATVPGGAPPPPPPPPALPDTTPPVISSVHVTSVTTTSAMVTWTTNESSDSAVDYGHSTGYASGTAYNGGLVTSHALALNSLLPGSVYHFRVLSRDGNGNQATSGDYAFQTTSPPPPPPAAPVISNVRAGNITDKSAVILWDTDKNANSRVDYGHTADYGLTTTIVGLVSSHSVSLSALHTSTTYHFRVISVDAGGRASTSTDQVFLTLPDVTPPANPSGFHGTAGDGRVELSWHNPSDADFDHVVVVANTDHNPASPSDGRLVYQGADTQFPDSGLTNGTQINYAIFAFDASGNFSSGALAAATPAGPPAPPPVPPPPPPPPGPSGGGEQPTSTIVAPTSVQPIVPVPTAPTTTKPIVNLNVSPVFLAANGTIELSVDAENRLGAPSNQTLLVRVPVAGLGSMPDGGTITVGNSTYRLAPTPSGDAWSASFVPAIAPGDVALDLAVHFTNNGTALAKYTVAIQPASRVMEQSLLGPPVTPVAGAKVTLYVERDQKLTLWDGGPTGQANPAVTAADGTFSFVVPNGLYQITVAKDGYVTANQDVNVSRNAVVATVALQKIPQPIAQVIKPQAPLVQNIQSVAKEVANTVQAAVNIVRAPEVQAVTKSVVVPTVVTVGVANAATAINLLNILNYLRFLITQPILLFGRRRRKQWGFVYNALSKQPVDLAIVRLIHADRNIVLQTRITNAKGQFAFAVKPGRYRLEAVKPGFIFPTKYLKDDKEDVDLLDLYHGEPVEVTADTSLTPNIPLDPPVFEETPKKILFKKLLRQIQHATSWIGLVITMVALIIVPSIIMGILVVFQLAMLLLFRRLSLPPKPKDWGLVFDDMTKKPVERAVVRLFHKKYNKLLETQITDKAGKYSFFVGKDTYYLTADTAGYDRFLSTDFDFKEKKEAVIDAKIPLSRHQEQ